MSSTSKPNEVKAVVTPRPVVTRHLWHILTPDQRIQLFQDSKHKNRTHPSLIDVKGNADEDFRTRQGLHRISRSPYRDSALSSIQEDVADIQDQGDEQPNYAARAARVQAALASKIVRRSSMSLRMKRRRESFESMHRLMPLVASPGDILEHEPGPHANEQNIVPENDITPNVRTWSTVSEDESGVQEGSSGLYLEEDSVEDPVPDSTTPQSLTLPQIPPLDLGDFDTSFLDRSEQLLRFGSTRRKPVQRQPISMRQHTTSASSKLDRVVLGDKSTNQKIPMKGDILDRAKQKAASISAKVKKTVEIWRGE